MLNTERILSTKWLIVLIFNGLLSLQAFAQENNCNNGLDDDGDGLIDCFDSDCGCYTCDNKQDNYWLFGNNVRLNFNNPGFPSFFGPGLINAQEGVTTVADPNGNLVFASNGMSVTGVNLNTNGITLKGGASSTHAAVAVPNPADKQEYYIFTSDDAVSTTPHGINAVKIRFERHSTPLGSKDAKLILPNNHSLVPGGQHTEKLAVARHDNCRDYWVVTHDFGNNYITYKVDTNGIDTGIISPQTQSHVINQGRQKAMQGQISFSQDYTTLVAAVYGEHASQTLPHIGGFVEITSFNNRSGNIYPQKILSMPNYLPYGVCLSPSKRYLYVSLSEHLSKINYKYKLVYYDLNAGSVQDILNTETEIPLQGWAENLGQLKIGPDQQLYLAVHDKGIVRIPNPDNPQAIYSGNLIFRSNSGVKLGLPQTIPDYCEPAVGVHSTHQSFCIGEQIYVGAYSINAGRNRYEWSTGHSVVGFFHQPQQNTTYSVTMTDHYGCIATSQKTINTRGHMPVSDFHLQDAAGTVKTAFQCGEDIFLDGLASSHETDHWIGLWEVDPTNGSLSQITGGGWQGGPVNSVHNLKQLFGTIFQTGKRYRVKLAVKNLTCSSWEEQVLDFTIGPAVLDANFILNASVQTGTPGTVTLTSALNGPSVEHYWYGFKLAPNGNHIVVLYKPWQQGLTTVSATSLSDGDYTFYHFVRSVGCGGTEFSEQGLLIDWVQSPAGEDQLTILQQTQQKHSFEVSIYPNPTQDVLNINTDQEIEAVRIMDLNGKMVKQAHHVDNAISVAELVAGVYIIELKSSDAVVHKQFVKQ